MRMLFGLFVSLAILAPAAARASASPQAIAVLNVEQRWLSAIAHHDEVALGKILGDDYARVNYFGTLSYRQDELAAVRRRHPYAQKTSEQTVDFAGDAAIVRGVNTVTRSGRVIARLRYTDVYALRAGRWVAVASQETTMDDPGARAKATALVARAAARAASAADEAAASGTPSPAGPELGAHTWMLIELSGREVTAPGTRSLQFDRDRHAVSGSAGCNRLTGAYQSTGTTMQFGPLATTRMMCTKDIMDGETAFLAALASVRTFSFENGRLGLFDATGTLVARFTAATSS